MARKSANQQDVKDVNKNESAESNVATKMKANKDGLVKVENKKLAGQKTNVGETVVTFDENGEALVTVDVAEKLNGIPDFTIS